MDTLRVGGSTHNNADVFGILFEQQLRKDAADLTEETRLQEEFLFAFSLNTNIDHHQM